MESSSRVPIEIMIRPLKSEDLDKVLRIQAEAYKPELIESRESFLDKLTLYPEGCLGAWKGDHLCAYIFSQPFLYNQIIPLNQVMHHLPVNPDCLYIHDLAVGKQWIGGGKGTKIFNQIRDLARKQGYRQIKIVAVQGSEPFWTRLGFIVLRIVQYIPTVPACIMGYIM